MSITIYKRLGRYDFCSTRKEWCVEITGLPETAPASTISMTFDEDDEPDIVNMLPSEVVEILNERCESYLFNSSRKKDKEIIQWIRDHAKEVDSEYAKTLIKCKKENIEKLQKEIEDLNEVLV